MPSPFPGMDPYLESAGVWPDFHARFINYWCEAIADRLPPSYEARIGERIRLVSRTGGKPIHRLPDVAVVERRPAPPRGPTPAGGVATLEPVSVPRPALELDGMPERYIEIYKRPNRSLVTDLELLSPSNKFEPDRSEYLSKRNELMGHHIHLVELDLLTQGLRLPMGGPLPPGDYYAIVSRGDIWPDSDVYAWTLRQALPSIPVPLRDPDPDIWIDLGTVFATAYERGRYATTLEYDGPPEVPLDEGDRAWALERVRAWRG